jgi:hypothetical protein
LVDGQFQRQLELKNLLQSIKLQNMNAKSCLNYFRVGVELLKSLPTNFQREKYISAESASTMMHMRECFDEIDQLLQLFLDAYCRQFIEMDEQHKLLIKELFALVIDKVSHKLFHSLISAFAQHNS